MSQVSGQWSVGYGLQRRGALKGVEMLVCGQLGDKETALGIGAQAALCLEDTGTSLPPEVCKHCY